MLVAHLFAALARSAAAAGGAGFYDARSWLVAIALLGFVVGLGWSLRRPVRRRSRARQRRLAEEWSARAWSTADLRRDPPRAGGPKGPDDDEEFLRSLSRRYPPA